LSRANEAGRGGWKREGESLAAALEKAAAAAERKANIAQWEAWTTGSAGAFARYEEQSLAYRRVFSSPRDLRSVERLLAVADRSAKPLLVRRLEVLRLQLAEHAVDRGILAEITRRETALEEAFGAFRGQAGGGARTSNELLEVLQSSSQRSQRREAWEALKTLGPAVQADLLALMALRNRLAVKAGFPDYWHLRLTLTEISPAWLMRVMGAAASGSADAYARVKAEIDAGVARHLGIRTTSLEPWDYGDAFFQEVPPFLLPAEVTRVAASDPVPAATRYFGDLGFDVTGILGRSSLYEGPGKNPHAFCTDIDRRGDVRVLANLKNTLAWHSTLLHELGHAVYSLHVDRSLPWALRNEAHSITTEGIALFFDAVASTGAYLARYVGLPPRSVRKLAPALGRARRMSRLVFLRWCQVMVRFEKAAYANVGADLDRTWWKLVERYQGVTRPKGRRAPDWATKMHIIMAPVIYQNYLLGTGFAAQLRAVLRADGMPGFGDTEGDFSGRPAVSDLLVQRVFRPGKVLDWQALVRAATGRAFSVGPLLAEVAP